MTDALERAAMALASADAKDQGSPFQPRVTEHDRTLARAALARARGETE